MDGFEIFFSVCIAVVVGVLIGLTSYHNGRESVREQAIAAEVACYKVDAARQTHFEWNCQQ